MLDNDVKELQERVCRNGLSVVVESIIENNVQDLVGFTNIL